MQLEVHELEVRYGRVHAVRGVSAILAQGEIVAVMTTARSLANHAHNLAQRPSLPGGRSAVPVVAREWLMNGECPRPRRDRRGKIPPGKNSSRVARMEPSGLAFGKPKDRLREMRRHRSRITLTLHPGCGVNATTPPKIPSGHR